MPAPKMLLALLLPLIFAAGASAACLRDCGSPFYGDVITSGQAYGCRGAGGACSRFTSGNCTVLAPGSPAPGTNISVPCAAPTDSPLCQAGYNYFFNGLTASPNCQPSTEWVCMQSCGNNGGDFVKILGTGTFGTPASNVVCQGPNSTICTWYRSADCTVLAPLSIPSSNGSVGAGCAPVNFTGEWWCPIAARQVYYSSLQAPCPIPPMPSTTNVAAIAGGVVGGVVALAAVGGGTYYAVDKKKKRERAAAAAAADAKDTEMANAAMVPDGKAGTGFYGAAPPPGPVAPAPEPPEPQTVPFASLPEVPDLPQTIARPPKVEESAKDLVGRECFAVDDLEAEFDDDLDLKAGDVVVLKEARSDGYGIAVRKTDGKEGLVPLDKLRSA
ncbi:hypothetical protein DFJ74DRAFT_683731 [Hyaloraphidium curvatum]|nr:hypothetical protein DFJ74DRAFT_683731 [Hyaloraphidium curvatum]